MINVFRSTTPSNYNSEHLIPHICFNIFQSSKTNNVFKEKAAEFLLQCGAFGALLLRDLTLRSAASFGMHLTDYDI